MAALAQLARLLTRGAQAGSALAASYRRALTLHASQRWRHGQLRGRRGREQGDGEGEDRRWGGEREQGCGDSFVGGVAAALDNNGEDDGGGRRHKATTNPMMATMATMATMAAVADNDGDGGQR